MKKTKNKLGKFILLGVVACGIFFLATKKSFALGEPTDLREGLDFLVFDFPDLSDASVYEVIASVLNWLLSIVGIMGVLGFAVSGIMYITALGEEKKVTKAKDIMLYSIMGVIVSVLGLVAVYAIDYVFVLL
ncbi:MAG: hypothetical protein WAV31_00485 [Candidatus Moraniibacteriota bacterium]